MLLIAIALQASSAAPSLPPRTAPTAPAANVSVPATGAPVSTSDGVVVGRIAGVADDVVVVTAGSGSASSRLSLSTSDFRVGGARPVLAMTSAQLSAAVAARDRDVVASRAGLLRPGTAVVGADGAGIGKVASVSGDDVVLDVDGAGLARVPAHSFIGAGDVLVMAWSRQQIVAMMHPGR